MKTPKRVGQFVSLLVAIVLTGATPMPAQRRATRSPAQKKAPAQRRTTTTPATPAAKPSAGSATPARQQQRQPSTADVEIAFDELLAADSYTVYAEVRGLGQLVRTGGVMELIEPLRLLGQIPKEMSTLIDFVKERSDTLATSRMLIAGNPAVPTLPKGIVAIELPSPEAARRFVPELRAFLRAVIPPSQTGDMVNDGSPPPKPTARARTRREKAARSAPPFHIKRAGSLVIVSDVRFAVQSLRPENSEPLAQQERFQTARNHFPTDAVFVYVDIDMIERMSKEERERRMEEYEKMKRSAPPESMTGDESFPTMTPDAPLMSPPETAAQTAVANYNENVNTSPVTGNQNSNVNANTSASTNTGNTNSVEEIEQPPAPVAIGAEDASEEAQATLESNPSLMMGSMVFGGMGGLSLPSMAGTGLSLDGDEVVIRTLLINKPDAKASLIPFISVLKPGPPVAPDASTVAPADTELLVNLSLDLPLIYQTLYELQTASETAARGRGAATESKPSAEPDSKSPTTADDQLAAMEKLMGFSIKEDLLPALGNEVAVGVPGDWFSGSSSSRPKKESTEVPPPGLMVLVSLRDKDKVQKILPRALALIGLMTPGAGAATEKYKDVEIFKGGSFVLSFVGNFLVVAQEITTIHRIADAYSSGQTLAASSEYRKFTNWQPRQSLGQVYVSGGLLKRGFAEASRSGVRLDDETKSILARFTHEPEAITHAVTGEGANHLHELHLPKSLITMAVATAAADAKNAPLRSNEFAAMYALRTIAAAEATYKETKGKGSFGTLEELIGEAILHESVIEKEGYTIRLTVAGDKFEVTATPKDYGKSGFRSFYVDASGVLRGGDKGGQQAGSSDEPTDAN